MNTITQEELDGLKLSLDNGTGITWVTEIRKDHSGNFPVILDSSGQCVAFMDSGGCAYPLEEIEANAQSIVSLHNLAPALIAAAEEGLKAKAEIADNLKALEESAVLVNKLDNEKQDLRARVQELEHILNRVVNELPTRRDWLDPVLEAHMRDTLSNSTPQPPRYTLEGWQTIETAPKSDGKYFFCDLAWGPEEDKTTARGFRWNEKWFACPVFYRSASSVECQVEMRQIEVIPTHWIPLPPAPQQKEGE